MKGHRQHLLPCLGALLLPVGCVSAEEVAKSDTQAPCNPEGSAGDSGPPLVTPDHEDLAPVLSEHTGDLADGAKTPGMIAAVVRGKHIVAIGASGFAKLDTGRAMSPEMIFNIGSNTKSIAAALLSILIEETPELSWDTTLGEALPWAHDAGVEYIQPAPRKDVTLAALVAHRSGIACRYEVNGLTVTNQMYSHPDYDPQGGWKDKTHEEVLMEFLRGPVVSAGGTPSGFLADCIGTIGEFHYENGNFTVAQAVIDAWSGMAFVDYAKEKLGDLYGMGATYLPSQAFFLAQTGSITGTEAQKAYWNPYFFRPDHPYLSAGKYVWGHSGSGAPMSVNDPDEDPWAMSPASGGFAFNMCDWARYAIVHLRDTSPPWREVHEKPFEGYNFGFSTGPRTTGGGVPFTSMCHTGSLSGMRSKICLYPEIDIAYLSISNGGPDGRGANDSVLTWMAAHPDYRRDAGGCKDDPAVLKGVQRFYHPGMFGCAGKVTFAERASLCASEYHVCAAEEFVANNSYGDGNAEAPKHHYWTDDVLEYGESSDGCWAAKTAAPCDPFAPMRVCSPDAIDFEGNECPSSGCGYGSGSTKNRYFGGCGGGATAGALCCKDD